MKKTFLSTMMAVGLGSMAFGANADVEIYGTVDTGFLYSHTKVTGEKADDSFEMASGLGSTSVFGFRGSKDLGNGMKISFLFEAAFESDTGASDPDNFFGEESSLTVSGNFGALSVGRMGALTAGAGTYDIFMANADAMDGGYADFIGAGYWLSRDIYNNTVTYQSPEINGVTLYAQYSLGTDDDTPSCRDKERYAALGSTYTIGNLNMVFVVDTVMKNRNLAEDVYSRHLDDAYSVSFGVNYDMGFMKPFLGIQYGKNENSFAGVEFEETLAANLDGYALAIGSAFAVWGGELQVSAYYADGDGEAIVSADATESKDIKRWGIGAFHNYELSERTSLYVGAGYDQTEVCDVKSKGTQVLFGMTHNF